MSTSAPARPDDAQTTPKSEGVPRWVPISLLALTTAALVVPVVLLRRHKSSALSSALKEAAPPPRRTATSAGKAVSPAAPTPSTSSSGSSRAAKEAAPRARPEDDFNFALYGAKAFGYATLMVTAGAAVSVWGVKTYMGVKDTQEFADRMRTLVRTQLPVLSSRIHRPPADDDHTATIRNDPARVDAPHITISAQSGDAEWAWPDAEKRLVDAYERDGVAGWAQAALQELEAEGQSERRKRGHD